MKILFLCLFFLQSLAFSATNPPRWKFAYHYGQAESNYIETQPSIVFENRDIDQKSAFQEFEFTYFLLPPFIDITLSAQHTGLQYQTPEDESEQFQYITGFANIGLLIPFSDFFELKLVAEYFYTTMITQNSAFGFQNLVGAQAYPELEFIPFGSTMFQQITPYFKFPLFSTVGNRRETTYGLKWKIPLFAPQEQIFPTYAYQRSIILRIFYTRQELEFEQVGYISSEMKFEQVGATLGFSF